MAYVPSPAELAEIKRKAENGIKLAAPTAEKQKIYDSYIPKKPSAPNTSGTGIMDPQTAKPPVYTPPQPQTGIISNPTTLGSKNNGPSFEADVTGYKPGFIEPAMGRPDPTPQVYMPQMPDYEADIRARLERQLQERQRQRDAQKAALQADYERGKFRTTDNRQLENARFQRTNDPFSGATTYRDAMIGREREQIDSDQERMLQSALAQIDQGYYDFEKSLPDLEREMINEERRRMAELTGYYPGLGRTLQGQQFDLQRDSEQWNRDQRQTEFEWQRDPNNPAYKAQMLDNEINKLKLDNLPQELKLGLINLQNKVKSGQLDVQTARIQLDELKNPNSPVNQKKKYDAEIARLEALNLPQEQKLRLQQLKKQIAEIGKAPYRSPQEVEMDKVRLESAKIELENLKNPKPESKDINSYISRFNDMYLSKDPDSGQPTVVNPSALRSAIIGLNLPDDQTDQLLLYYGLPTN